MASGGSGVKKDDLAQAGVAQGTAAGALGVLAPTYANMAAGNDGLTQQQKSNLLTSSGQSLGGTTGAIVGQGALQAARTGNSGSYAALADAAARGAQQQQSSNALGVQESSDALAQRNQLAGLAGEQGIYGDASRAGTSYMNLAAQAPPSFLQNLAAGVTNAGLGLATKAIMP